MTFFTSFNMWWAKTAICRKKSSVLYVSSNFRNDTGDNVWQNGKMWHGRDAFRKVFSASDVLFEWPQRTVWGNDLWHAHLDFKLLVHEMVLLTSFHIFSISRNLAKLKLYVSGQNDFFYQIFSYFQVLLNQQLKMYRHHDNILKIFLF